MRGLRAPLIASLLALILAPNAVAAPRVSLHARFAPDKAGASTTIYYGFTISEPAPLRSMELRLPYEMGLGTSSLGLRECTAPPLLESGLEGCSPNALLGFGTALAEVPFGATFPYSVLREPLHVTALLGEPANNNETVLIYIESAHPVAVERVLTATILPVARPYGDALKINVPNWQTWPEGPDVGITRFTSTIGPHGLRYRRQEHGKTIFFEPRGLTVPLTCPKGGFPIEARFQWWNSAATAVARVRVPCPH
ncbi:MAG: hypothetical protein ACYC0H_09940 [Solirubrobacteraceae bacterium]